VRGSVPPRLKRQRRDPSRSQSGWDFCVSVGLTSDADRGPEGTTMAVTGTWKVLITRLDKSKLRYSEQRGHGPRRGDILETVVGGRLVKAEVEMFHHEKRKVDDLDVWTIEATEV
jgi:hypothetical protein